MIDKPLLLSEKASRKLRRFLELTLEGPDIGKSDTTENSESSESSEDTESSETTEDSEAGLLLQKLLAVNPDPDEWGEVLAAAETVLTSRLARR